MNRSDAIVRIPAHAYRAGMALRLLRMLVLLAVVLMPIRMAAEAQVADARTTHATAAASPCGEHDAPAGDDRKADLKMECMMACAALTADDQTLEPPFVPVSSEQALPERFVAGRNPASDPPPPRFP